MAVTEIPWGDGSGDKIYLTRNASEGDQIVSVSSDANTGASRSKVVSFATGIGNIVRQLTVSQDAGEITPNHPCITFRSTGSNTLSMECAGTAAPTLYYSTDGVTWSLWDYSVLSLSSGHPIFIYGDNPSSFGSSTDNYARFVIGGDGNVECSGNIMTLVDGSGTTVTIPRTYYFVSIFSGCTKLTKAPDFPATTLKDHCYRNAFYGCSSLVTPPALPATTLAQSCYRNAFYGCSSLVTPPALPATTLKNYCYSYMFYGCSSLTTAPILPATTLVSNCYTQMFRYASKLNYIKAMFTTAPGSSYTSNWVGGVASSGTFVKNSAATWTTTGNSAVPSAWTVIRE